MLYQSLQNSFSLDNLEQMLDLAVVRLFTLWEQTALVAGSQQVAVVMSTDALIQHFVLVFLFPFPVAVIVKKTFAIKQNHLMIDSKSTEISFFQCLVYNDKFLA